MLAHAVKESKARSPVAISKQDQNNYWNKPLVQLNSNPLPRVEYQMIEQI